MDHDLDPLPQARIVPNGEPIEGGFDLFEGSIEDARAFLATLDPDQRAAVSIWTPGHVFTPDELDAEAPGHEHDPDRHAADVDRVAIDRDATYPPAGH